MSNHVHIYKGTVTAGGTDGTQVSEGTNLAPITVGPLNATSNEESGAVKLAIRCDAGYVTTGNTTITPTGTTAVKWALAPDNAGVPGVFGAYGASLTIATAVDATNTIFWAKAKATADEADPVNDATVKLQTQATVAAA